MGKSRLIPCVAGLLVAGSLAYAAPASAQATRTWVSGVGDDVNPCSRTAPCKTFAGAISKTAAGGEINCLDQGAYGTVTITKSISLYCEGVTAGVLHSATNGIVINAGPNDHIALRGLDINGGTPSAAGLNSIRFLAGGSLLVENVLIRNAIGAAPNGWGINFAPSTVARLTLKNVTIHNVGTAVSGGGVLISPTGTGSARASISNLSVVNAFNGVIVDTPGNTGAGILMTIDDSNITGGVNGVTVNNPPATTGAIVFINDSVVSNNTGFGIQAKGSAAARIRVADTTIALNGTGVSAIDGATIASYGTNRRLNNTSDGAFSSVLPQN
ncbi:hypothetical protein Q9Q95_17175 [Sphingomonas sp. DG1-23]|jgi:hypothetical protein|uniref:hypothetical protein n=1 Tax=Sphingomonas sp. DG1-23 TaxID=3068316 RepID=UPI00273F7CAD|nr:hypothetical protein [Sphingomonas sp. DG1-23]MDP5280661.1 hypothetical protein [Sphingomonas sp. DG1-23]